MIEDIINTLNCIKEHLNTGHVLTYSALLLAFLAYRKSIREKYNSWKLLLQSFKSELDAQKAWLSAPYNNNHPDKQFFSPYKIVYKLSFESAKEIARSGISFYDKIFDKAKKKKSEKNDPDNHNLNITIAIFNERVDTFNALLDYHRNVFASDSLITEKLIRKLVLFGLTDEKVQFNAFNSRINQLKNSKSEENKKLYFLAFQMYNLNNLLHAGIIGNNKENFGLHNLYCILNEKIDDILKKFDKRIPWYLKTCGLIIIIITSLILLLTSVLFIH